MDNRELEPLSNKLMADLTIEELEERLEMQIVSVPDGSLCLFKCQTFCIKD